MDVLSMSTHGHRQPSQDVRDLNYFNVGRYVENRNGPVEILDTRLDPQDHLRGSGRRRGNLKFEPQSMICSLNILGAIAYPKHQNIGLPHRIWQWKS